MTIEKLFESLDEKVFTSELKEGLQTQFNEAVEIRAQIIADERIEEEIDHLEEKSKEYTELLEARVEDYSEYVREETLAKVSEYLDLVVEEFVKEAEQALIESAKSEKADMMIEAFDSMLLATGMDFAKIAEAAQETSDNSVNESLNVRNDSLVEEVIALKRQNDKLVKLGVITEMCEGLTLTQQEKFKRLANVVDFSRSSSYVEKLETILESVKGSKEAIKEKINEDAPATSSWAHLV